MCNSTSWNTIKVLYTLLLKAKQYQAERLGLHLNISEREREREWCLCCIVYCLLVQRREPYRTATTYSERWGPAYQQTNTFIFTYSGQSCLRTSKSKLQQFCKEERGNWNIPLIKIYPERIKSSINTNRYMVQCIPCKITKDVLRISRKYFVIK